MLNKLVTHSKIFVSWVGSVGDDRSLSFHSLLDLDLENSRRNNDRGKEIDVQLDILNRLEQQPDDSNALKDLRSHLLEEKQQQQQQQNSTVFVASSSENLQETSHVQILPVVSRGKLTTTDTRSTARTKETVAVPIIDAVQAQIEGAVDSSTEPLSTKLLFEELQQMSDSIELAYDASPTASDPDEQTSATLDEEHDQTSILPNLVQRHSSTTVLFPRDQRTSDSSTHLKRVGNVQKYAISLTRANERRLAKMGQRWIDPSQRDYGEVFVRHRVSFRVRARRLTLFVHR